MMKQFISENGGIITLLIILMGLGGAYLEWRIDEATTSQLNAAGLVTPEQLEAARRDIDRNAEDVDKLESADERFEGKIDRIVDILLED
jgi:hypothetical protein